MLMMFVFFIISFIVSVLLVVQWSLSSSFFISDPQLTSLESGFEMVLYGTLLSSSFFLLAVLFVLFDVELILLLPCMFFSNIILSVKLGFFMILISFLLLTLLFEWEVSGLKWLS